MVYLWLLVSEVVALDLTVSTSIQADGYPVSESDEYENDKPRRR